jgi:AraC family transcriptional regulator, regulatory protein of adaptative response / methylated-DNA-[protein]-cysteine methyltransferase
MQLLPANLSSRDADNNAVGLETSRATKRQTNTISDGLDDKNRIRKQEPEFVGSREGYRSGNTQELMNTRFELQEDERAAYATDDAKWQAVVCNDRNADGKFYYSVSTTGVYCLPSCPARKALRKRVAFHTSPEDAERAGFRACKRCRPNGPTLVDKYAATVAKACRALETAEEAPTLYVLAKSAGMSPYYFHRIFKAMTGLTPKAYAVGHRAQRVRKQLSKRNTVTEAIYDAGFNSNSRFYAKSAQMLGMTPSNFRNGGNGVSTHFAVGECTLGTVLVAASAKGVCAIFLGDDPNALVRDLQNRFPKARLVGGNEAFESTVAKVIGFIETPKTGLDLPLDVRGTAFQQKVWQALRDIPVGSTVSYRDIAARIGAPKAVRAIAQACGANALAVAIPCHRVVRNDGSLSGYRWGVQRKGALLRREAAQ